MTEPPGSEERPAQAPSSGPPGAPPPPPPAARPPAPQGPPGPAGWAEPHHAPHANVPCARCGYMPPGAAPGHPPPGSPPSAPAGYPPPGYAPYGYPGYPPHGWIKPGYVPPPGEYGYPGLARSRPGFAHWRLPVVGVVFVIALFASIFAAVIVVFAAFGGDEIAIDGFLERIEDLDPLDTGPFLFTLFSLIVMIPLLWGASAVLGYRPFGLFSSVTGRLRWGWLARCVVASLVAYAVLLALMVGLELATGGEIGALFMFDERIVLALLLVILVVPFQAAAEEYVFRGYAMQLIGSWVRTPVLPILLPVPLFVLAHGYGLWGMVSVGFFALVAGYLVWRTGGLEAAIAVHAIHNIYVFSLDLTARPAEGTAADPAADVEALGVLLVAVILVAFALWARWAAKRHGVERTVRIEAQSVVA